MMFDLISPAVAQTVAQSLFADPTAPSTLSEADKFKGLLIGAGILIIGGSMEIYSTLRNRYRAYLGENWPRVPGTVILHRTRRPILSGLGRVIPLVRYSYTIDGVTYEHDAVMFGGHAAVKSTDAQAVLRRYPLDSAVQVIVDPKNPRIAALETTAIGGNGLMNGATMALCGVLLLVLALVP